jgi:hypothetical protein
VWGVVILNSLSNHQHPIPSHPHPLYAETSITIVMYRIDHLYDNLYDLFDQRFAVSTEKNIWSIPLGPLYYPRCLLNDDFTVWHLFNVKVDPNVMQYFSIVFKNISST